MSATTYTLDHPRYAVLGASVNALTIEDLNTLVAETVASGKKNIIANHNLHSIYLYHRDARMRAFYEQAQWIHIDGMPIVLLGRAVGLPLRRSHRVTYVDWTWRLMAEAARRGWRVFYLGSKPGVAGKGATILRDQLPQLQIATAHGYFDQHRYSAQSRELIGQINDFQTNILMLGMGMPRQEIWAMEHLHELSVNVILNAGAAMDYVAGVVPKPPRWAGRMGLEWLFRLLTEPQRLGKRYLIEPWLLLGLVVKRRLMNAVDSTHWQ